jgi:hypothetical protein
MFSGQNLIKKAVTNPSFALRKSVLKPPTTIQSKWPKSGWRS